MFLIELHQLFSFPEPSHCSVRMFVWNVCSLLKAVVAVVKNQTAGQNATTSYLDGSPTPWEENRIGKVAQSSSLSWWFLVLRWT